MLPIMVRTVSRFVTIALCLMAVGCGGDDDGPAGPSGSSPYQGEWSGTTTQNRPISFTVSSDQKVTALTVGYNFGGCSGTSTLSNLSLDIGFRQSLVGTQLVPGFAFSSSSPDQPNQIVGEFSSNTMATGNLIFVNFQGCGSAFDVWTANKR